MTEKRGVRAQILENAGRRAGLGPDEDAAMLAVRADSSSQEWRGAQEWHGLRKQSGSL
jgi:hypothetical protein